MECWELSGARFHFENDRFYKVRKEYVYGE